jgi:hypothetical protein
VTYLTAQGQEALVSPSLEGLTCIDTPNGLAAQALSPAFRCSVFLARVDDGAVFQYWLYDDGRLVDASDAYTSASACTVRILEQCSAERDSQAHTGRLPATP